MTTEPAVIDGTAQLAQAPTATRLGAGRMPQVLGGIAYRSGKDALAAEHFAEAIRLEPENGDYYTDLALVLSRMGEKEAAISGYRAAVRLKPGDPVAHNNLGAELRGQRQFAEAVACFCKAATLRSGYMDAYYNLGCVLRDVGKPDRALEPLCKALALSPQTPEIHKSLGNVLVDLGRPEDAILRFLDAIRLRPDYLKAYNNLGSVYCDLDRLEEAKACFLAALAIDPNCASSHNNLGVVLQRMGRPDLAVGAYREAIRLDPEMIDAPNNLAMALLLQGDYAQGWRLHEKRWRSSYVQHGPRAFEQPMWTGGVEPQRLLIHAEQGLGDTLQFCRYLPLIYPRRKIVLEVQPPLVDLMRQLPGVEAVVARDAPLPDFDAHCPIMSLPLVFGTTLENIPNQTPYLRADPVKVLSWAKRLEAAEGLRVGLVWAGGARPNQPELEHVNRRRSTTLAHLAPLAQARGVSFVSLQKGPPASEVHAPPPGLALLDFTDDLRDFTDTAALVANLDLVISVDTAVAHLAGAMGKPVWLMNRFDTCWRWLLNRDDSPWYPTLRLFRQPAPGDWDAVAMDIAVALKHAVDLLEARRTLMVRAA